MAESLNRELKALIGLSSPILFNEDVTDNDKPNPILEGPIGLCLFYDELWFLDESLCPLNMRDLEYVKFLDKKKLPEIKFGAEGVTFPFDKLDKFYNFLDNSAEFNIGTLTQYGPEIAPFGRTANPIEGFNRIIDEKIASSLGYDLVINSFSPQYVGLEIPQEIIESKSSLAYLITHTILCKIPNLQLPEGPFLDKVDELRKNMNRNKFKDKIKAFEESEPFESVEEAAKQIISEYESWSQELRRKATDPNQIDWIYVNLFLSNLPAVGKIYSCLQAGWKTKKVKDQLKFGWAEFLGDCLEKFRQIS
jgi:hypothetical protein